MSTNTQRKGSSLERIQLFHGNVKLSKQSLGKQLEIFWTYYYFTFCFSAKDTKQKHQPILRREVRKLLQRGEGFKVLEKGRALKERKLHVQRCARAQYIRETVRSPVFLDRTETGVRLGRCQASDHTGCGQKLKFYSINNMKPLKDFK